MPSSLSLPLGKNQNFQEFWLHQPKLYNQYCILQQFKIISKLWFFRLKFWTFSYSDFVIFDWKQICEWRATRVLSDFLSQVTGDRLFLHQPQERVKKAFSWKTYNIFPFPVQICNIRYLFLFSSTSFFASKLQHLLLTLSSRGSDKKAFHKFTIFLSPSS